MSAKLFGISSYNPAMKRAVLFPFPLKRKAVLPPLMLPLMLLLLLTLSTTEVGAIWVPDDDPSAPAEPVAPPPPPPSPPIPPPPSEGITASSTPLPGGEELEVIPTEGSGGTDEGNAEEYTDDQKWLEEGKDVDLRNLDQDLADSALVGEVENQRSREPRLRDGLAAVEKEQVNADDMYFDEDSKNAPHEESVVKYQVTSPVLLKLFDAGSELPSSSSMGSSQPDRDTRLVSFRTSQETSMSVDTTSSPFKPSSTGFVSHPPAALSRQQTHVTSPVGDHPQGDDNLPLSDGDHPQSDGDPQPSDGDVPLSDGDVSTSDDDPLLSDDGLPLSEAHPSAMNSFVPHTAVRSEGENDEEPEGRLTEEVAHDIGPGVQLRGKLSSSATQSLNSSITTVGTATAATTSTATTATTTTATTTTMTASTATTSTVFARTGGIQKLDPRPGSDAETATTSDSIHDASSKPSMESSPSSRLQDPEPTDPAPTSPSPAPPCLQECIATFHSFPLLVEPAHSMTMEGDNLLLQCLMAKDAEADLDVTLYWKFTPQNGSGPCSLGPNRNWELGDEAMEECARADAEATEELSNQTETAIRLAILGLTTSDSGEYDCVATASCCQGTAHAQRIARREVAVVQIYGKPQYSVQLATVSVMCLFLLTGILGTAGIQRRRRRKKRVSGPGHVYYEPVRLLHLPLAPPRAPGAVDDDDDDFDDMGADETDAGQAESGRVRVNPMAEVPLTPPEVLPLALPEVMPPPPEVTTSPVRESRFEFPRPPSDLMKRMSSNVGFD